MLQHNTPEVTCELSLLSVMYTLLFPVDLVIFVSRPKHYAESPYITIYFHVYVEGQYHSMSAGNMGIESNEEGISARDV